MSKTTQKWDKNQEKEFKEKLNKIFNNKIAFAIKKSSKNPLEAGNNLGNLLKNLDKEIVEIITPRAVKKWASSKTIHKWEKILKDPQMVLELREIGKSIANSMRPIAGNKFALWVTEILNAYFQIEKISLKAITKGRVKSELSSKFIRKLKGGKVTRDYKPDIDIVIIKRNERNDPVAIISAKTTLAERIMQTITWHRYLESVPEEFSKIKLFLVTAWETFEAGTNKERVQELDGVYVCNKNVKEYGKIKLFSKIGKDLKKLL